MPLPTSPHDAAFHGNRHGVLAIPGLLWLALALLARQWVLLMMVAVNRDPKAGAWARLLSRRGGPRPGTLRLGARLASAKKT